MPRGPRVKTTLGYSPSITLQKIGHIKLVLRRIRYGRLASIQRSEANLFLIHFQTPILCWTTTE